LVDPANPENRIYHCDAKPMNWCGLLGPILVLRAVQHRYRRSSKPAEHSWDDCAINQIRRADYDTPETPGETSLVMVAQVNMAVH
jgi:hypothetical protein